MVLTRFDFLAFVAAFIAFGEKLPEVAAVARDRAGEQLDIMTAKFATTSPETLCAVGGAVVGLPVVFGIGCKLWPSRVAGESQEAKAKKYA